MRHLIAELRLLKDLGLLPPDALKDLAREALTKKEEKKS